MGIESEWKVRGGRLATDSAEPKAELPVFKVAVEGTKVQNVTGIKIATRNGVAEVRKVFPQERILKRSATQGAELTVQQCKE